jgi:hypothetical protein
MAGGLNINRPTISASVDGRYPLHSRFREVEMLRRSRRAFRSIATASFQQLQALRQPRGRRLMLQQVPLENRQEPAQNASETGVACNRRANCAFWRRHQELNHVVNVSPSVQPAAVSDAAERLLRSNSSRLRIYHSAAVCVITGLFPVAAASLLNNRSRWNDEPPIRAPVEVSYWMDTSNWSAIDLKCRSCR